METDGFDPANMRADLPDAATSTVVAPVAFFL
jgi:hypothetical protein